MKHHIDWNFKVSQANSFITAASLLAAFSLALFIEYDESAMEKSLKIPYYTVTTCAFVFSLSAVIIAVGLTRIISAPDISNETSQGLMTHMKQSELPVAQFGLLCFFLGMESFIAQFAIIALAKIDGTVRWIPLAMSLALMAFILLYSVYCVRRVRYYNNIVEQENASYDLISEAVGS